MYKRQSITSVDIGRKLPDEHSLFGLAKAKADAVPAGTTAKSAMPDVCWAKPACEMAGIDLRTLQRWQASDGLVGSDRRPQALRPVPRYALSEAERAQVLAVANALRFAPVPPARIVPMLADKMCIRDRVLPRAGLPVSAPVSGRPRQPAASGPSPRGG